MANAAGKWARIQQLKGMAPFLMYDAVRDGRTRPLHRLWGGLDDGKPIILPADHPAWSVYFPPCGWNCRCGVIQLSQRDLDRMGLRVTTDAELAAKGWMTAAGAIGGNLKPYRRSNGTIEQVPAGIDPGFGYNPGEHYLSSMVPPATEGELMTPTIVIGDAPPMPPARERPASSLLPRSTGDQEAVDRFIASFEGPTDGTSVLAVDKLGEPMVIDDSLFSYDRPGQPRELKIGKRGRIRIAVSQLLAEALRDPDEIWYAWVADNKAQGQPAPRLTRRYVTRFVVDGQTYPLVIVMQFGEGGWRGVTAFPADTEGYLNSPMVRAGTIAYRRP